MSKHTKLSAFSFQNKRLAKRKIQWILIAMLSFIVAMIGLIKREIYEPIMSTTVIPGALSQDLIVIIISSILFILSLQIKDNDLKKQSIIMGIVGFLFYGYGIYVIERVYNFLYFGYMAIFGLSFYAVINYLSDLHHLTAFSISLSKKIRYTCVIPLMIIPIMFSILWIGQLIPLIQTGNKIENLYSIYIIDLCFILPSFFIVGIKVLKRDERSMLILPMLFIIGFAILLPVGLAEIFKQLYDLPSLWGDMGFYLGISGFFALICILYIRDLRIKENHFNNKKSAVNPKIE